MQTELPLTDCLGVWLSDTDRETNCPPTPDINRSQGMEGGIVYLFCKITFMSMLIIYENKAFNHSCSLSDITLSYNKHYPIKS